MTIKKVDTGFIKALSLCVLLGIAITRSFGAELEILPSSVKLITDSGTIVFEIESTTRSAKVPVPFRLLGIKYPEKQKDLTDLREVFRSKFSSEVFADPNTKIRIYTPYPNFTVDENGIALGVIEIITKKTTKDGALSTGTLNLTASLLSGGAFYYDGSLANVSESLDKIYKKAQETGRKNGFGVWYKP